ncbi:hypothetical protein PQO01_06265 [Lentisphaera marina]|uniref:Trm112 family protein n=1 Tax=Lentisphaera marina TaxID=1111041 RepID=UPI002366682E|nr:Trm112 family protein [Lentisphaera marina]MDD7984550.1 hypothetical protein [Lentisphaera marina]
MQLKSNLLDLLDCPVCKSGEGLVQKETKLSCGKCGQEFKLKALNGPSGQGVLMPDFLEFEE